VQKECQSFGELENKVGEKLLVDFTGKKMSYVDRITGEAIPAVNIRL